MPSKPLFVILDGYSMAYRHYHGTLKQQLTAPDGSPTGAIFGFSRQILDIMLKDRPHYLAVAWDEGLSDRETIYPEYKANRDLPPEDFEPQVERIREMLTALNIPGLAVPGYEADDVIGTLVREAEAQDVHARIVTGDGDLLQLITDNVDVFLLRPFGGPKLYDRDAFHEKYQLEPHQLVDLKALQGDTSDNIPGIKGVGEKTATPLIQQYGSLAGIYAHLDEVKASVRKKLDAGRESAFMSYKLARVMTDLPLPLHLPDCVTSDYTLDAVVPLFEELGFNSLLERLYKAQQALEDGPPPDERLAQLSMFGDIDVAAGEYDASANFDAPLTASDLVKPYIVRTGDGLQQVVDLLAGASLIAFDTETTGTNPVEAELVGISLAVDGENGYYIPVGHIDDVADQLPLATVLGALRPALTDPNTPKVAHNASYDVVILERAGLTVTPVTFDTMIAEWVRDSTSNNLGLGNLVLNGGLLPEGSVVMQDIKDLIGTGKKQITMAAVPVSKVAPYAAEDAALTWRLVEPLRQRLAADERALHIFEALEMPLVPVIATIEQNGVLLDSDHLAAMSKRLDAQLAELEQAVFELAGVGPFNLNSTQQLSEVLFDKLGLPRTGVRKTKHGTYSTAAAVLEKLYDDTRHPVLEKILEHRELVKLKGTYVDALPKLVSEKTGRLHTSFNQTGTTTGRLSSSDPNLQNIPVRTEIGREVRRAFIAPPGRVLLSVDYSQVELRIMAHIADEPYLKRAFADGLDIHAATAAVVNDIAIGEVSYSQRSFAKRVNFGLLYGMGAFRLARDSDLTLKEADAFINTYFERLPNVKRYIEDTKAQLHNKGYVETLMGRRRYFGEVRHMARQDIARAEREAVNMPVQGTAADIMKKAMLELHHTLIREKLGALITLQVHDELVLEVPEDELEATARLTVEVMENTYDLDPQLRANAVYGHNWRDMEPVPGVAR